MKQLYCLLLLLTVCMATKPTQSIAAQDQPYVASVFTDNMVLQRGQSDPVWGWATPGAVVTVRIAGKGARAVAGADGLWTAKLPPLPVGGPYTLTVSGPQTTTFKNILVGDVWICSGQSNMEFGIGNGLGAAEETAAANYPQIRLFVADKRVALDPQRITTGQWLPCTPDAIQKGTWNGFSAVGYFFGRDLYQSLHIPIGLIQTSWGGTPAEAWTSESVLAEKLPAFQQTLTKIDALRNAAKQGQTPQPSSVNSIANQNTPSLLFNGMIAPLIPYGIKGVIWYQGETNAGRAYQYQILLPAMIADWRQRWQEGDFPFLIVQLAGYAPGGDSWPDLREAQWLTAKNVPNAGIATAIDLGEQNDIHPKNKQEVGRRLALVALSKVYGRSGEYSGPVYKSMTVTGGKVRLTFDHLGGGLVAKDGKPLTGFTISDATGNSVPADAQIVRGEASDLVVVSASQIPNPVAVRYDWAAYPDCTLYNKAGLPAFPFRTDSGVALPGVILPANAGSDLALGMPVVCSDPNTHGWDRGLTDGSWDPGASTTFATNDANTFPKTATIDLGKPAMIGLVAVGVPPFGSTKTITVSVSADGQDFREVGSYVFSVRREEKHLFRFAPVLARYVRLTYPDHSLEEVSYPPTFVFTSEAEVYAPIPSK